MKTVFIIGIIVNFLVVIVAVAYINYVKKIEIFALSQDQKTAIVKQ